MLQSGESFVRERNVIWAMNDSRQPSEDAVLFVDDDINLLAAFERNYRRHFRLETAAGGEVALETIAARGPFAVVVADMQMPRMDGMQFLTTLRERAPDTVRIMLTGNANLEMAIRVVNESNSFRFLTKPCPPEVLGKALEDALKQYRLVLAEKELLNQTLSGSIKLLTDILSVFDASSFGRSETLRAAMTRITAELGIADAWEMQLAVMLSPIGNVTLPPETLVKARNRHPLSKVEQQMLAEVPEIASRLLANIPRLDGVARIVRYQYKHFDGTGLPRDSVAGEEIPFGSRLLRILNDQYRLVQEGLSRSEALAEMRSRRGWYDPKLLAAVQKLWGVGPVEGRASNASLTIMELAAGMTLHSNIFTKDGMLVLSAGHCLNETTVEKLQNFNRIIGIAEPIFVELPDMNPPFASR